MSYEIRHIRIMKMVSLSVCLSVCLSVMMNQLCLLKRFCKYPNRVHSYRYLSSQNNIPSTIRFANSTRRTNRFEAM